MDNCSPHGSQGYQGVLLQLFGYTGHGKSCYINSCKFVVDDGSYHVYAKSSEGAPETMERHAFPLTETIKLVDNRGCVKLDKRETGEIYAQLGNFLPLDKPVEWRDTFEAMMENILQSEMEGESAFFIVPVFVYSVRQAIADQNFQDLKELLDKAKNITGIFPTIILTHGTHQNMANVKEKFRMMGGQNMFDLENYTKDDHLKVRGRHETNLRLLYEILQDVEFRMKAERDPVKDRINRKRFLYKFANERELEKQKEALENQIEYYRRELEVEKKKPWFKFW
ncbi:Hypothetical predicted protein [Pelobates cultripes]|nr:Hypothetical predicted protein [Pelobates cultripes]